MSPILTILTPQEPLIAYPAVNTSVTAFTILLIWDPVTNFTLAGNDKM